MTKTQTDFVYASCLQIREDFQQHRIAKELLVNLYQNYHPLAEPERFIERSHSLFPQLNCGITSVYLQSIFGGQIIRGHYSVHNHTFLMLDGRVIIDLTADQYDGPKVYIGPLVSPWTA